MQLAFAAIISLAGGLLASALHAGTYNKAPEGLIEELSAILSPGATISTNLSSSPRWSDYFAPEPGLVVHVAEEMDVAKTVKYCNQNSLRFLAQAGARGWATTFDIGPGDVVIDLRGLNFISFNEQKSLVTVGGGVLNGEIIEAAYANGVQVLNGGCNCVGVLGSTLGGGVSRWMNRYGMSADNLMSATLVTAKGDLLRVSEDSHPELLWAIRGAGPNFGIVTSAVLSSHPTIDNGNLWAGELIFSGDVLERYIDAVNHLNLTEDMTIHWGFSHPPPTFQPVINAEVFFMRGDVEAGRRAFQPLYDLGPIGDTTELMTYAHINDDTIGFCEPGGRKPGWFAGLKSLDAAAFRAVWNLYVEYVARTNQTNTGILVECYSTYVLREDRFTESTSYPHRDINFYAMTLAGYESAADDAIAEAYASRVRDVWREASGFKMAKTYINFAHGDESLEEIYGASLPRLRMLKMKWDPKGRFNQWFPIV